MVHTMGCHDGGNNIHSVSMFLKFSDTIRVVVGQKILLGDEGEVAKSRTL